MVDYKCVASVKRKARRFTKLLCGMMVVFIILFLLCGIIFDRGMIFPAFLLTLLYFVYSRECSVEYEYTLEGSSFSVDVIKGHAYRRTVQALDLSGLEIVAPHDHAGVSRYKKRSGSVRLPHYDYTSYDDNIPYYTMIIYNGRKKIKLLLDLNEELLQRMKHRYPDKVFLI